MEPDLPDPSQPPPPSQGLTPSRAAGSGSRPAGGWQPPTPEELQEQIPQYKILDLLGRGGMGAVYKGWQTSLERYVAIKILPPDMDDGDVQFTARFKQEARTMGKFQHPGIVSVYDAGETASGLLFIVMEFIEGTDVSQMVKSQGRLSADYALAITAHVCDALHYAHTHGVIHRDIKPANIMLNMQGEVKVADFGLAKGTEAGQGGLTKTNMTMGTPDYVAPEVLLGGVLVDHRADLYAIGVMLYNMLTGEIPRGIFKPPSQKVGTDARFDAIIIRAMEQEREARYQDAMEIRRDLDVILNTPEVKAEPPLQSGATRRKVITRRPAGSGPLRTSEGATPDATKDARRTKQKSSSGMIAVMIGTIALLAIGAFFALQKPKPAVDAASTTDSPPASSPARSTIEGSSPTSVPSTSPSIAAAQPGDGAGQPVIAASLPSATAPSPMPVPPPVAPAPAVGADGIDITQRQKSLALPQAPGSTDALALVDPAKHATATDRFAWTKIPGGVEVDQLSDSGPYKSCLELLAPPAPAYVVEAFFTAQGANGEVGITIPVGDQRLTTCWITGSAGGWAGLGKVDGKDPHEPDILSGCSTAFNLAAGELSNMRAEVRRSAGSVDIQFSVNGKPMGAYRGPPDRLTISTSWVLGSNPEAVYIGARQRTTFHRVTVQALDLVTEAKPAAIPSDPQLAKLESGFQARYDADAQKPYLAAVAALNQSYTANGIARARAAAQAKGSLEEITALDAEKAAVAKGDGVPAADAVETPEAVKTLRATYRGALAKITADRDRKAAPLYDLYVKALDVYMAELTKGNKIAEAQKVQALRDEIAARKVAPLASATATTTTTASSTTSTKSPSATLTPASAKPAGGGSTWREAAKYLVGASASCVVVKAGTRITVAAEKDIPVGRFDIVEMSLDRFNSVLPNPKDEDFRVLVGLRDLQRVYVRTPLPGLSDAAFAFLTGNDKLTWINLEGVPDVTDGVLVHIAGAKKLQYLGVQYAKGFTGKGLEKMPFLATLTDVDFLASGITNEGVKVLAACKQLKNIRVNSVAVTDAGFASLRPLKSLTSLTVYGTAFGDEAAAAISELRGLTSLDLSGTKITDAGLSSLMTLKKLTALTLSNTPVTVEAAAAFQKALPQCRVSR